MKRNIYKELLVWKTSSTRKPLLLRGARQVGKSHLLRAFGKSEFENLIEINFELQPEYKALFQNSLDPAVITRGIALTSGKAILEGQSLLFFDEIQACPEAITSLRYFYEKMPRLHVIGAGSLVEFALESEKISMPVGRVQSLFLYPFSFQEFLAAKNESLFLQSMKNEVDLFEPIQKTVHEKGLNLVREYSIVGGMPEALSTYFHKAESLQYRRVQLDLMQTFRDDFGKYARRAQHRYLEKVFLSAPALLSKDFKYSLIDREIQSRDLKGALLLLEKAGILRRIKASSGAGLPLEAHADEKRFKLMFLDIGLALAALGLDTELALADDFTAINAGAVAEQFVAQELLGNSVAYEAKQLYYWAKTKKGSSAEVDFLYPYKKFIFPIEVKSGATGKLKSMKAFLEQYEAPFGIRISSHHLSFTDRILSVPFYLISSIDRLLEQVLDLPKLFTER
jgi:predicted AAA+ superfamily ATPase